MTATHTGKANRRYCYYASAMTRVPSGDLDGLVLGELRETLASPARLATALPSLDLLSPAVIAKAAALAVPLAGNDIEAKHALVGEMVERVDVTEAGVTTTFRLEPLGLAEKTGCIVTLATLGRSKARLSLVVPGHSNPKPDNSLIAIIAQARGWLGELTSGRQSSIHAIARASRVTPAYIRQHIGAGFLAPDLVTRIVEGRQPTWLTLTRLTDMLPLPADWPAQRALFAAQN
jgi:hypothetical protein